MNKHHYELMIEDGEYSETDHEYTFPIENEGV